MEYEDEIVQSNLNGYHTKRCKKKDCKYETNHRKIKINEILVDIDTHARSISSNIADKVGSRLIADKLAYSDWDTSRSRHLHLFFKDMHLYPKEVRNSIRKEFLRHYCKGFIDYIDLQKSEDTMIRAFNSRHEVTGKNKVCVFQYKPKELNKVPKHILDKALANKPALNSVKLAFKPTTEYLTKCKAFIHYCLTNRFDYDGGRNQLLFKNIAIAVYNLQLKDDERDKIFIQIASNCKGKIPYHLRHWYLWCLRKKNVEVNWNELKLFYNDNVPPTPKV